MRHSWSRIKKKKNNFDPLEVVGRASETQLEVGENLFFKCSAGLRYGMGCIDEAEIIPCPAELFVSIFHSFEAGIANAISSFK